MGTLETIAAREAANLTRIELYLEGMFLKAYEHSAYMCVELIAKFKPSRRFIKYLECDVVSIGFPVSALDRYFPDKEARTGTGTLTDPLIARLYEDFDLSAFESWKNALPLKQPDTKRSQQKPNDELAASVDAAGTPHTTDPEPTPNPPTDKVTYESLIHRIRNFRLEAATPLQCVAFIDELKRDIDGCI